jgi:membrane protein
VKQKIRQFKKWVLGSRLVFTLFSWSKRLILPGFGGMSLYGLVKYILESFQKSAFGIRSSAIAFKFFLALFPGLLFFVSLIPFVPIDNFQENLLGEIDAVTPDKIYVVIESTINDLINTKHHFVLSIGILMTLFYASNGINTMLTVFNSSHQIELRRSPIKQRLLSLGLFAGISVFIILALVALTYGEYFVRNVEYKKLGGFLQFGFQLLKWLVMILSLMIAMGTLFNLGNPQIKSTKWVTP